jgi:hypothetical protein
MLNHFLANALLQTLPLGGLWAPAPRPRFRRGGLDPYMFSEPSQVLVESERTDVHDALRRGRLRPRAVGVA